MGYMEGALELGRRRRAAHRRQGRRRQGQPRREPSATRWLILGLIALIVVFKMRSQPRSASSGSEDDASGASGVGAR